MKKKELLTVKELAKELRMGLGSIWFACRKRAICLFSPSLLHLDTSDHMWIHLINSHHSCKRLWSGTVGRIDQRNDRYDAHLVVGERNLSGIGSECAIDSTCLFAARDPLLSHQHNAALQPGPRSADFTGQGCQRSYDHAARDRRRSRRRAQQHRPRSVTRGHYPQ